MSALRLNAAEKDLEKFIKFLALKSTQVVVQSRLGEKIQTQCSPLAGNDWFNLVVHDHPDVYDEAKRALALNPGESILQRLPLCIEISLRTVEGDQMVLEVWSLDLLHTVNNGSCQHQKEDFVKGGGGGGASVANSNATNTNNAATDSETLLAAHAIYNRMGIMLKSLVSLTRATPAYKLSRRQCPEAYGIYYRIYVDRPQVHTLGEGHKNVKIGQLTTIVGALVLSVAYRTKMTISPTAAEARNENTIMLKSDHFRPTENGGVGGTPTPQMTAGKKVGTGGAGGTGEPIIVDIEKPLRPGAFTDMGKLHQYTDEDYVLPETPPFEWLLRRTRQESTGSGSIESLNNRKCESPNFCAVNGLQINGGGVHNNNKNNNNNADNINILNHNNNLTAFKGFEKQPAESKTSAAAAATTTNTNSPIKSLLIPMPASARNPLLAGHHQDDDNLLKELIFPFASPTSQVNDLAKFYRDCYHAPPLRGLTELQAEQTSANATTCSPAGTATCGAAAMLSSSGSSTETMNAVDDLSLQLEQFETSLEDYDKLVSQFGLTGSSSTGSRSSGGLQMSN